MRTFAVGDHVAYDGPLRGVVAAIVVGVQRGGDPSADLYKLRLKSDGSECWCEARNVSPDEPFEFPPPTPGHRGVNDYQYDW